MSDSAHVSMFWDDPAAYFGNSYTKAHSVPKEKLESLQLAGLQQRFSDLKEQIPFLDKLAAAEGVKSIDQIDDIVPLLFLHTTYKSYPAKILNENRFGQLNAWMNKLTAANLGKLDAEKCESIDDWINGMHNAAGVMPWVSSGTSGKMTFYPHSAVEMDRFARTYPMMLLQNFGEDPDPLLEAEVHEVWPFYRYPGGGMNLDFDLRIKYMLGGDEGRFHALFPSAGSLDIRFLQAQQRLGKLENFDEMDLSPAMAARAEQAQKMEQEMPTQLGDFMSQCTEELNGKSVLMLGTWPMMYHLASQGLAAGKEGVFAPNSRIMAGGGRKGTVLPDNWRDDVCRFMGVEKLGGLYGMTECLARHMEFEEGHYHICPWIVPFLLDPDSSKPLKKKGRQTGRFAFFDLLADSHWGGVVTGDRLTIEWSEPTPSGHPAPYIVGEIARFADYRDGVDKFQPVANEKAHNAAMTFLNDIGG